MSSGLGTFGSRGVRITGKLDLNVPPYLKLDHDSAARRLVLSIEDNKVKQQMEMWGMCFLPPPLHTRLTDY